MNVWLKPICCVVEQEGLELAFERVDASKRLVSRQMQEKALGQALGVLQRIPTSSAECVKRIPIEPAQLNQSGLPYLRLTLRRPHDDRPACGVKARRALHWRTMVGFHEEVDLPQR